VLRSRRPEARSWRGAPAPTSPTPPGEWSWPPANGLVRYVGEQAGTAPWPSSTTAAAHDVLGPLDPAALAIENRHRPEGRTGPLRQPVEGREPYLHVELRVKSEAVDPSRLLR
jgi:hypothetical protein